MSQYKAAMTRMLREESAGDGDDVEGINATDVQTVNLPSWAQLLKDQSVFLVTKHRTIHSPHRREVDPKDLSSVHDRP